jgi:UDP-N-acetylglucosamine pyrophosphorylase
MENNNLKKQINWEKIGIYFAAVGFIILLVQSQMDIIEKISEVKERIAKLEVKIEYLEKK